VDVKFCRLLLLWMFFYAFITLVLCMSVLFSLCNFCLFPQDYLDCLLHSKPYCCLICLGRLTYCLRWPLWFNNPSKNHLKPSLGPWPPADAFQGPAWVPTRLQVVRRLEDHVEVMTPNWHLLGSSLGTDTTPNWCLLGSILGTGTTTSREKT